MNPKRMEVVREVRSWIGTPYHNNADVKGAGVDCGMLLVRVFVDTGCVEPFDPRPYPPQWNLHRRAERYMEIVQHWATEVEAPESRRPLPGDIVLFHYGLCYAHGGIVTEWPEIIHALGPFPVGPSNVHLDGFVRSLRRKIFTLWPEDSTGI